MHRMHFMIFLHLLLDEVKMKKPEHTSICRRVKHIEAAVTCY